MIDQIRQVISERLSELPWTELAGRIREIRSAFRPLGTGQPMTY